MGEPAADGRTWVTPESLSLLHGTNDHLRAENARLTAALGEAERGSLAFTALSTETVSRLTGELKNAEADAATGRAVARRLLAGWVRGRAMESISPYWVRGGTAEPMALTEAAYIDRLDAGEGPA